MTWDIFLVKRKKRAIKVLVIILILLFIAFLISMNSGSFSMNVMDVLKTLIGKGTDTQNLVLYEFRLPRMVNAILVGAGLAVSGAILQAISRNGLSDPGILGINSGAGLTILIYAALFPHQNFVPPLFVPFLALIGGGLAAFLIYILAYKKGRGISPTRLLLVGIAVGAGMKALTTILTLKLNPQSLEFVVSWQIGSLWGTNWTFVFALLPWLLIFMPYVIWKSNILNILSLNEQIAGGLGVRIERERLYLLISAVALAASSVAIGGSIGFIGLLAPHIARKLVGAKHQYMIPITALIGSLIVLSADTIARSIMEGSELPVGVVVSLIGAPYFLYLLIKTSKKS